MVLRLFRLKKTPQPAPPVGSPAGPKDIPPTVPAPPVPEAEPAPKVHHGKARPKAKPAKPTARKAAKKAGKKKR